MLRPSTGGAGSVPMRDVRRGSPSTTAQSAAPFMTCRRWPLDRLVAPPAADAPRRVSGPAQPERHLAPRSGRQHPRGSSGLPLGSGLSLGEIKLAPYGLTPTDPSSPRSPRSRKRVHQGQAPSSFGRHRPVHSPRQPACNIGHLDAESGVVHGQEEVHRTVGMPDGIGHQLGGHQAGHRFELAEPPPGQGLSDRGPRPSRARGVIGEGDPEFDSLDVVGTASLSREISPSGHDARW